MSAFHRRRVRNLTFITDLILINLAFLLGYFVRYELQWLSPIRDFVPYKNWLGQQALLTIFLGIVFWQLRVWRRQRGEFWVDEIARIGYATATAIAIIITVIFIAQPEPFSRGLFVWVFFFILLFLSIARLGRRFILTILHQKGVGVDRVVVVGAGEVGRGVIRTFLARPDLGFRAIGYLDDGNQENSIGSGRIPRLGDWGNLARILDKNPDIYTVFIALPATLHSQTMRLVRECHLAGIRPQVVPDLFELSLGRVEFNNMAGIPVFSIRDLRISWWGQVLKRFIDLAVVTALALPVGIMIALLGIAIKLDSPGPIFFRQKRVGKAGKPFSMYKLRSMVIDAEDQRDALKEMSERDGPIFKIRNDPRLTKVGRIIRRLSFDELPQIWNVFTGEMSLVGPRPPLPDEVVSYSPWHHQRLSVKGGITGLWQVSGRADLTFDEQCLLDIYYIENWSLGFDVRLMLQTIPYSLFGRGAY